MKNGTCLWFDWNRGYGFIEDDDTKETYFVHYSQIVTDKLKESGEPKFRKLEEGEKVEFEVGTAPNNKPCAVNVRKMQAS